MKIRFAIILILLVIIFFGCNKKPSDADDNYIPPETSVVDAQFNFHIVSPGVWRSAQPDSAAFAKMKIHGLKTIINLRGDKANEIEESRISENLDLNFFSFPMDSRVKQDTGYLREILNVVTDSSNQPVLIHCLGGKDRSGLIVGLYEKEYLNRSFEEIKKEMIMYGHDYQEYTHILETVKNWGSEKAE